MRSRSTIDDRMSDIIIWGDRAASYVADIGLDDFESDLKTQDAVIRCLEVVGEASAAILKIDPNFEKKHAGVHLSRAYRARNRTAHGYGSVDIATVWRSATVACPNMVSAIKRIAREPGHDEG